jgi:hypothetical protein
VAHLRKMLLQSDDASSHYLFLPAQLHMNPGKTTLTGVVALEEHLTEVGILRLKVGWGVIVVKVFREQGFDPNVVQTLIKLYEETRGGPLAGMPLSMAYLPLTDVRGGVVALEEHLTEVGILRLKVGWGVIVVKVFREPSSSLPNST